jgi:ABC-type nitrate/sulfonate/bicarbonate transport system substrate-binding protein
MTTTTEEVGTMSTTPRPRLAAAALLALLATAALALAACGSGGGTAGPTGQTLTKPTRATLVLDFVPNAVHAGIYRALAAGYYKKNKVDLSIIQPTSTADTLKLIDAGKADFGIADGIDVASQIDLGRDARGVMALVQRPLGGPIALRKEGLASPAQLQGKTVGLTGVPSDVAVLDTTVAHAGGDPRKVKRVTIGFNGVQNLENGKVAAFTGFWPADGVQVQVDGLPITVFKLDENGGPGYPGLVVFSTRRHIADAPGLMRAFVDATVRGYQDTLANPQRSLEDLLRMNKSLKRKVTEASLMAYQPLFKADAARYGELRPDRVAALAKWLLQYKLIKRDIAPARYGTNEFLPKGG